MKIKVPGQDLIVEIGPNGCSVSKPGTPESVGSTESKEEWYQVTSKLSSLVPFLIYREEINNDGVISDELINLTEQWATLITTSLKNKKPLRDLLIRRNAHAITRVHILQTDPDSNEKYINNKHEIIKITEMIKG